MPVLQKILVSSFKNIDLQELSLSPNINCITGDNGEGKTNLLDAVYYLSMTKSAFSQSDRFNYMRGRDAFAITGFYAMENGLVNKYSVSVSGGEKSVRLNDKAYDKISDHIGVLPVVIVSPYDISLVNDSGEERRRFLNSILSQLDREYMRAVQSYNKLLLQRNSLLKTSLRDMSYVSVLDEKMSQLAGYIHEKRVGFVSKIIPVVRDYYRRVSGGDDVVDVLYRSDLSGGSLAELLKASFERDCQLGYTTRGVQRDDLEFVISGFPLKKCGSQGEQKSFMVALKFAQYSLMRDVYGFPPMMLLDDLFDKLDQGRVSNLLKIVLGNDFGQVFITDCNRSRMRNVVDALTEERAYFEVEGGCFTRVG